MAIIWFFLLTSSNFGDITHSKCLHCWHCTYLYSFKKSKISDFIDLKTSRNIKFVAMFWQYEPWMKSPSASASFCFAYDVESASRKFSKWRWNVSHARLCACHRVTLGHIGTVGLSPYISLVFPKIFMARGRYLKYFQRFKRKISISATHWNDGIKCLKVKANLWLLHPIHCNNGILCSKCLIVYFAPQNWRLWCPYRQNELVEDLFRF